MNNKRIVFHIDVNNAYLSWTAVKLLNEGFETDIRNEAYVIAGDETKRHGIVLAKSPIAKAKGIVTAETLYNARKKCPQLKVLAPDFNYYKKCSDSLFKYLSKYTPIMEIVSIDECYLDMSNTSYMYKDILMLAYHIKDEIKNKFGFTVNVGIANNKLCAKMASDFEKPDKVHTLFDEEVKTKMWPLDVSELFMVGKKSSEKIKQIGINTIGELANTDVRILNKYFKSYGNLIWQYANGIDNSGFEGKEPKNKGISSTDTLPKDTRDFSKLKKSLLNHTESVCYQARKQNLFTNTVTVIIRTSTFINFTRQENLSFQTNDTEDVYSVAVKILEGILENPHIMIRNIGVRISNLKPKENRQLNLFEKEHDKKQDSKMHDIIDAINERYGTNSVMKAALYDKANRHD